MNFQFLSTGVRAKFRKEVSLIHQTLIHVYISKSRKIIFKACKIEVGLRNNFRLAGWDLGSPCVQAYHVILLNSRSLYPEFENELRKSACLSSFSKRWEGFVICLSCQLNYLQEIKWNSSNSAHTYNKSDKK